MVIAQVLVSIYTLILIGWLSTETYGLIAANYAAALLTSFVVNLGLHEWLIKTIPLNKDSRPLTGAILGYKILAGLVWAAGLIAFLPKIKPGIYSPALLIVIILDTWFESSFYLLLADLLGNGKVIKTSVLLVTSRFLRLISILAILILGSKSALLIVSLRLVSTVIIFAAAFLFTRPKFKGQKIVGIFRILRSSIIFNAAEIQNLIFLQIDLNLFTLISSDQQLIGYFAIAISLINMIMSFPLGIAAMLLPNAIKTYNNSQEQFQHRMKRMLGGFLIFGILIGAGVQIFRLEIIQGFFSQNYRNAFSILILASPLLLFRIINQVNRVYLIAVGEEKKQLLPQLIAIVFKLVIGFMVTKAFALVGLIRLSIISDLFLLMGFTYQVLRHYFRNVTKPTL